MNIEIEETFNIKVDEATENSLPSEKKHKVPVVDRAMLFLIEYFIYFIPVYLIFRNLNSDFNPLIVAILPLLISFLVESLIKKNWVKNLYGAELRSVKSNKVSIIQDLLRLILKPISIIAVFLLIVAFFMGGILLFWLFGYFKIIGSFIKRKMFDLFYDKSSKTVVVFKEYNHRGNFSKLILLFVLTIIIITTTVIKFH